MARIQARIEALGAVAALAFLLSTLPLSAREAVPHLDVDPGCRAAEAAATVVGRDRDNCRADESSAKDALGRDWDKYSSADKSHCTALVQTGGPPSYVELLSCLEISRDARKIRQDSARRTSERDAKDGATTGAGAATTGSGTTSSPAR
jgi:hypothetical protein